MIVDDLDHSCKSFESWWFGLATTVAVVADPNHSYSCKHV